MPVPVLVLVAVRAARWRRWAALALLSTATVAFAAAGVAPLWANAAEDSLIDRALTTAPATERLVALRADGNSPETGPLRIPVLALQAARTAAVLPAGLDRSFGPPRASITTQERLLLRNGRTGVLAHLGWHAAGCANVVLVRGRCATADTEVALSTRTAAALDVRLGRRLLVSQLGIEPEAPGTGVLFPVFYRVVGLYRAPARGAFWAGARAFEFAPAGTSLRTPLPASGDLVLTNRGLMDRLSATAVTAEVRRVLVLPHPAAEEVDRVEAGLAAWDADLRSRSGDVNVDSPALLTLTDLHAERDATQLGSLLLGVQVLALIAYVLFLLVAASVEARTNDVALAKLRGLRRARVVLLGFGEPLLIVTLAAPLGLLAALGVAVVARAALLEDVALRLDGRLWLALLLAWAACAVAAALGLRQAVRAPVLDQLRGAVPSTSTRRLLVAEVVLVTLAVAALVQVRDAGGGDTPTGLAVLAPGLGAVAVAVVAGRLLQLAAVPWVARSRRSPDVAGFLAARAIGRRAGATRVALLVTVAVSLAAFAACSWQLTDRQRTAQAAMQVGADTVYTVSSTSAPRLLQVVRDIDVRGSALAAAVQLPAVGTRPPLLAVDATRLAAVSSWQPGWADAPVARLARDLRPVTTPSVTVRGREIELDVDARLASSSAPGGLTGFVVDGTGQEATIGFGRLPFGVHTLRAEAPSCARGCTLTRLRVVHLPGELGRFFGTVDFRALRVDGRAIPRVFGPRRDWRPARIDDDPETTSTASEVGRTSVGVRLSFNASPSESPGLMRADVPESLPVLLSPGTVLEPTGEGDRVETRILDGGFTPGTVQGTARVLPRLGPTGALVDLDLAARASQSVAPEASFQVWASAAAPPRAVVVRRLEAAGLRVLGATGTGQRTATLSERGPALVLTFLLAAALAGLLVAALAVVATAISQGRRRAFEVAALRTAGVTQSVLRSAATREYVVQVAVGLVCGLGSGVGTAALVGPSLGRLGLPLPVAPVGSGVTWLALAVVAAVTVTLFTTVTWLCARVGVATARAEVLRQAPA